MECYVHSAHVAYVKEYPADYHDSVLVFLQLPSSSHWLNM